MADSVIALVIQTAAQAGEGATSLLEDLTSIAGKGAPYGALGTAMLYAWRLTQKASQEAMSIRKSAFTEGAKIWAEQKAGYVEEINRLRELLDPEDDDTKPPHAD